MGGRPTLTEPEEAARRAQARTPARAWAWPLINIQHSKFNIQVNARLYHRGNWKRHGCRIVGHTWSPVAAEHWEHYCERCGYQAAMPNDFREPWTLGGWLWRVKTSLRHRLRMAGFRLGLRLERWKARRRGHDDLPF